MKVRVYAPSFASLDAVGDDGMMELHEGTRVKDVFKKLKIPRIVAPLIMPTLNYERTTTNTVLKDGDTLSFFALARGG